MSFYGYAVRHLLSEIYNRWYKVACYIYKLRIFIGPFLQMRLAHKSIPYLFIEPDPMRTLACFFRCILLIDPTPICLQSQIRCENRYTVVKCFKATITRSYRTYILKEVSWVCLLMPYVNLRHEKMKIVILRFVAFLKPTFLTALFLQQRLTDRSTFISLQSMFFRE